MGNNNKTKKHLSTLSILKISFIQGFFRVSYTLPFSLYPIRSLHLSLTLSPSLISFHPSKGLMFVEPNELDGNLHVFDMARMHHHKTLYLMAIYIYIYTYLLLIMYVTAVETA